MYTCTLYNNDQNVSSNCASASAWAKPWRRPSLPVKQTSKGHFGTRGGTDEHPQHDHDNDLWSMTLMMIINHDND